MTTTMSVSQVAVRSGGVTSQGSHRTASAFAFIPRADEQYVRASLAAVAPDGVTVATDVFGEEVLVSIRVALHAEKTTMMVSGLGMDALAPIGAHEVIRANVWTKDTLEEMLRAAALL